MRGESDLLFFFFLLPERSLSLFGVEPISATDTQLVPSQVQARPQLLRSNSLKSLHVCDSSRHSRRLPFHSVCKMKV